MCGDRRGLLHTSIEQPMRQSACAATRLVTLGTLCFLFLTFWSISGQ